MSYSACIFDFEGTLFHQQGFGRRLVLSHLKMHERISVYTRCAAALAEKKFESGSAYKEQLFYRMTEELNRMHPGVPPINSRTIARWYHHEYLTALIDTLETHYRTEEICLDTLKVIQRQYGIAVFSETGCLDERMRAVGIVPSIFPIRMSTDETGRRKPAPEVYAKMAKIMGVPCSEVLVIGDSREKDEMTAKEAGMDYFHIAAGKEEFSASWRRLNKLLIT